MTGRGSKIKVSCTSEGADPDARAIVSLARDHKVVAHGIGKLDSKIELMHKGALRGRYTLFVEIPGVTTVSKVVHL